MVHSKPSRLILIPLALVAAFNAVPSQAANTGATLTVSATVASACLISNGTLAFGAYDPSAGSALNAATTITLTCTPGTPYQIGMSAGAGSGATTTVRKLSNGGSTLTYRLFRNVGRTLNWGETLGTDTLDATTSAVSLTNTINVYGEIPASEAAPGGSYLDSVAITVTY